MLRLTDAALQERRNASKVIGQIDLKQIEPAEHLTCELGCVLSSAYQRQGYSTEAVAVLGRQALTAGGMQRVIARCSPENTASWKLLEKIGFRREGLHCKISSFGGTRPVSRSGPIPACTRCWLPRSPGCHR